jgi:predicted nucleotidyltransferase
MKKSDAIKLLRQQVDALRQMGAKSLYLFGSTARGRARSDSDIDIFIEPEKGRPFSLVDLATMQEFLRRSLQHDVDLTTRRSLHPMLRDDIRRSAIKIF